MCLALNLFGEIRHEFQSLDENTQSFFPVTIWQRIFLFYDFSFAFWLGVFIKNL